MAGLYVDTSAIGRVLLAEPEARAIRDVLASFESWWSSELLVVELRRLAEREDVAAPAERLLAEIRLVPIDHGVLERASRLPPMTVRTLDAIHLETAVSLHRGDDVSAVLTYDRQLQDGCAHHALAVESPLEAN
jgi:predicted nucleic acid-binding protein